MSRRSGSPPELRVRRIAVHEKMPERLITSMNRELPKMMVITPQSTLGM